MRRFFTEPENISDGMIEIIDDARHITNVLRMEPGDLIEVFDGGGYDYTAELVEIDSRRCAAKIVGSKRSELEPEIKATLYQGIPKSDKLDTIIKKRSSSACMRSFRCGRRDRWLRSLTISAALRR